MFSRQRAIFRIWDSSRQLLMLYVDILRRSWKHDRTTNFKMLMRDEQDRINKFIVGIQRATHHVKIRSIDFLSLRRRRAEFESLPAALRVFSRIFSVIFIVMKIPFSAVRPESWFYFIPKSCLIVIAVLRFPWRKPNIVEHRSTF